MEVFVSDVDGVVMLERIRSLSAVQTSMEGFKRSQWDILAA